MVFSNLSETISEQTLNDFSFEHIEVNGYTRLYLKKNDEVVMYDMCTRPIKEVYEKNMLEFSGDVLICGAGVGFCIFPIKDDVGINSITVIEKEQDIIDLLSPYLPGVTFICDDAKTYIPTQNYDAIFLDIWSESKTYEKRVLLERYKEFLKGHRYINFLEF